MVSVNASRGSLAQKVTDAVSGAKMIGFNDDGHACVWYGGYSFSVYDAANGWDEINHFTSGQLAGLTDYDGVGAYGHARTRMENEGFETIE